MTKNNEYKKNANLLIFYDWSKKLDAHAWAELSFQFFQRIDVLPNSAEYIREDGKTGNIKPSNLISALTKYKVQSASLKTLLFPYDDLNRYDVTCCFLAPAQERQKTAFFCYGSHNIDIDLLVSLTKDFIDLVGPLYGIGLQVPWAKGPGYFALDMLFTNIDHMNTIEHRREAELLLRWTTERLDYNDRPPAPFRHLDGMQRDVFPYNILTDKHLVRKVNGLSLREWILSSPERGFLKEISTGCWVWVVPSAELMKIRETLQMNDLLIVHPKSS